MTSSRRLLVLCVCLLASVVALHAQPTSSLSVDSSTVPGVYDAQKERDDQLAVSSWLIGLEGKSVLPGLVAVPNTDALDQLSKSPTNDGRLMVGVTADVGEVVNFRRVDSATLLAGGRVPLAGGFVEMLPDRMVWMTRVSSKGSLATRLYLTDVELPAGSELFVYSIEGEAFGPYTFDSDENRGELWTHTVVGSEIRLQLHVPRHQVAGISKARLEISAAAHLGDRFISTVDPQGKAHCNGNASCVQNASCSSIPSAIQPARDAVGRMLYQVGSGFFLCSGGLLNDTDSSSTIPYFITANHCFATQSAASSLEVYFQYSVACGTSNCPAPGSTSAPRVLGSTLLSTSSAQDYTFLQLNQSAPAGSTLLGWTTTAVANSNNTQLYRVSHPSGQPQAYSEQRVNTSRPTCSGVGRGNFIYSVDNFGATEGGSSGSPVLNSSGQVVGQLFGACGTNTGNVCDSNNNSTVDGALAAYYSSISQWLDPAPSGCNTGNPGSASYCSASCPCEAGGGDCDSNAECESGLICATDTGPNYGYASWVDVCEVPNCHVGAPGSASYCSASCPCEDGEGDCDNNSECVAGTECVDNVGPNYGWASWVDVCETTGGGSNPDSCVGNCGSQAPGGCWCDSQCASFGDCCSDKVAVCGP
ncbi:hypothetical protein ABI59_07930 [Acidobacteria bacterium Mor1]|nr:hypothetical protein ABI59_07930 [Acidobacteria bacterium Mor1]